MSGFLKRFDRLVSAQVLSGAHNLVLANGVNRYPLASLHYDPSQRLTGLHQGHSFDCLALASVAQALTYEASQFSSYQSEEVEAEITLNQQLAQQCLTQAVGFIKQGRWFQQTEVSAAIIYTNAKRNTQPDLDLYSQHICPAILQTLQNASTLNIIDITTGLVAQGYSDVQFWQQFLDQVATKTHCWNLNSVDYHGWETRQFQYQSAMTSSTPLTHTQLALQKFQSASNPIQRLRGFVQCSLLEAKIGFVVPHLLGGRRITYLFDTRNPNDYKQEFVSALKQVAQRIPEVSQNVEKVLKSI